MLLQGSAWTVGITHTSRRYDRFEEVVEDVNRARVLVGFHFFNSDEEGSKLGQNVGHYVIHHFFEPMARGRRR